MESGRSKQGSRMHIPRHKRLLGILLAATATLPACAQTTATASTVERAAQTNEQVMTQPSRPRASELPAVESWNLDHQSYFEIALRMDEVVPIIAQVLRDDRSPTADQFIDALFAANERALQSGRAIYTLGSLAEHQRGTLSYGRIICRSTTAPPSEQGQIFERYHRPLRDRQCGAGADSYFYFSYDGPQAPYGASAGGEFVRNRQPDNDHIAYGLAAMQNEIAPANYRLMRVVDTSADWPRRQRTPPAQGDRTVWARAVFMPTGPVQPTLLAEIMLNAEAVESAENSVMSLSVATRQ
jgi:hypothetical protein